MKAEPFADLVRSHVNRWRSEHPCDDRDRDEKGYYDGSPDDLPVRALVWLAAVANHIADPERKNLTKTGNLAPVVSKGLLENLISGEHEFIELRVAEAVAIALDKPYETAGVEVFPNPNASKRERDKCCASQPEFADDGWGQVAVAV